MRVSNNLLDALIFVAFLQPFYALLLHKSILFVIFAIGEVTQKTNKNIINILKYDSGNGLGCM